MTPSLLISILSLAAGGLILLTLRWLVHRGFQVPRETGLTTPAELGLTAMDVRVPTANGKILAGWLIAADGAGKVPAVVLMHGWGADRSTLLPLAPALHAAGLAVLLVDARSHGASDGDSFSSMPRFAEDIDAALDWLRRQDWADPAALAVVGHSVGGAAALLAASRRSDVAAVVSLSAFDHPERVMRAYLRRAHVPYVPLGWLVCRYVERVIGHRFDHIAPVSTIARLRCPVLIGHGADDCLVPADAARAIHARAGDNVHLRILPDAGHEGPADMDALGRMLAGFLVAANQP